MKVEDIKDEKSLVAWLNDRPQAARQSDAVAIAQRAALRVFPLWSGAMDAGWARKADLTALPLLRRHLTLGVARNFPTPEVVTANDAARTAVARAAANATDATTLSATAAARAARASYSTTTTAAVVAARAFAARATGADSDSAADAIWKQSQWDVGQIESGQELFSAPLWFGSPPKLFAERDLKSRALWTANPADWSFWLRWWDGVLSGKQLDWELQRQVALIPDEVWKQGPEKVAEAIREIEARFISPLQATALARAFVFDFDVHDQQLRMTGVALHFEGRSEKDIAECLRKLRDWKDDLQDWLDYAQNHLVSQNARSSLFRSAEKLTVLINAIQNPRDFPAGRLVTMGGSLRLLASDEIERDKVGETLSKMMDARLDDLSALLGMCFGHVLAQLEPLNELGLGSHDPASLIEQARNALDLLRNVSPDELLQVDEAARATFAEMVRELQELDAALTSATNPKRVDVLRDRFASRYGGLATTIGRSVEKGREKANRAVSRFDESVKWYKRWETIERIVDWFNSLGNSWPPPGL